MVEHTGWPRSNSDEERPSGGPASTRWPGWATTSCASCRAWPCPSGRCSVDAFAPWLEYAIEAFGVDRCMFASNFPVDSMYGTFDDLYAVFSTVTAGLDAASRDKLFAANAERIYRC